MLRRFSYMGMGEVPVLEGVPSTRYPSDVRWTGVLQRELGEGHVIIGEGLSGRTTTLNDPTDPRLDGSAYLPSALASHTPLDLVILMLGTNDTKVYFHRSAFEITVGISTLIGQILASAGGIGTQYPTPQVLMIAPPPLTPMPHPYFQSLFSGASEKTAQFGKLYGDLADFMKIHFLDAGNLMSTDGVDGIHFSEGNNLTLGKAVAEKVRTILPAT